MAITIIDPARFAADGGLGTRRFVRAAFNDEGYGVSNRFSAYAQGGSIVPDQAYFNSIGAGTAGDPLRLSQFNGLVAPRRGAKLITGSSSQSGGGGKGVAYWALSSYGYTTSGTFSDVPDEFYSLNYPAFGSLTGQVAGYSAPANAPPLYSVYECIYHYFTNETPLFNKQLIIIMVGNMSDKTYTPYVNGTAIAGAKAGIVSLTNPTYTTFRWNEGTDNTGNPIPENDTTTPDSNPFGANGTECRLQLL